jgi:hypothetical protein
MLEAAVLAYGLVTTFVVQSASRNRKEARANPPILNLFGWALMSFSGVTGAALLGYAGLDAAGIVIA